MLVDLDLGFVFGVYAHFCQLRSGRRSVSYNCVLHTRFLLQVAVRLVVTKVQSIVCKDPSAK